MFPLSNQPIPPSPELQLPVVDPGDMVYDNAAVKHQLDADRNSMLAPDISKVLIIYTGGTIGMKHTPEHGYIPHPNYLARTLASMQRFHDPGSLAPISRSSSQENLKNDDGHPRVQDFGYFKNVVHAVQSNGSGWGNVNTLQLESLITPESLYGKRIRYSILEYDPLLDSCNMTMSDWARIAWDIEANYQAFDAFIVLHGTDTMAYTASALSFMLEDLGKTVIITGSQVPLAEVRNDAVENLLGALTIAGHFVIPEVCLYFGQKLYRGNRTSKISAVDFDAFDSPNLPPLVHVGIDIVVKWPLVLRPTQIARFRAHKELNPNVATLRLFPGISETTVRSFLAHPVQGVVLETFGAGNAPARIDLLEVLKEACDRGVVIVNCTQCLKGVVSDSYATGRQLSAIGVVPGADMTPECALTKLSYLLGKIPNDPAQVRRLLTHNLRGELTVRAPIQRFSASQRRNHPLIDILLRMSALGRSQELNAGQRGPGDLLPDGISAEEQHIAEKELVPMLLCSAAASNDLESIQLLYEGTDNTANLHCLDYENRSPLHLACREGNVAIIEFLLRQGVSIHVRDRSSHTPLYVAAVEQRAEAVLLLRKAGAHLTADDCADFGPLWLKAVREGQIKFIKIAFDAGWDVNWAEPVEGRRAIDVAVCEGRVTTLKVLLGQDNLDLSLTDRWGATVMDKIAWLEKGAKVPKPVLESMKALLNERLARDTKKHLQ